MHCRSLYLCYFGLREPLVQTQVLPYLREISDGGIEVSLLTFEPNRRRAWTAQDEQEWRDRLAADGIRWFSLPYHKRPSLPATLYDILAGTWAAVRLARRHRIQVLHARSHVPMAMALLARPFTGCRLIFDFRGLMADEYADAGVWTKDSPAFRAVKWVERLSVRQADQLVVLTHKMRDWLIERGVSADKIEVIPCCVDFSRFAGEETPQASGRFELIYAGAATGSYLIEEMGRFFQALRERVPDALFRVLTPTAPEAVSVALERAGLKPNDYWVGAVPPSEVPDHLRRARMGIFFHKPAFSKIASSPTKVPEYLLAGLPVVCSAGMGDTDELLENAQVGVAVSAFTAEAYQEAVEKTLALAADPDLQERCASVVGQHFDLSRVGGPGYLNVYRRIQKSLSTTPVLAETR